MLQDTALRILHPRFYGNSTENMKKGLIELHKTNNCDFIVAGRMVPNTLFLGLQM